MQRNRVALFATLTILLALAVAYASGFLGPSSPTSGSSLELTRAGDDVVLADPPPLSGGDAAETRERLRLLDDFRTEYWARQDDRAYLVAYARRAAITKDLISAHAAYKGLVRLYPSDPAYQDLLGQIDVQLGLYSEAAELFRGLTRLRPENVNGYIGLAQALYGMGQRDETIKTLEEASRSLLPADAMGHLFIGREFEKLINYPSALAESERAWRAMPLDPVANVLYARILNKLRRISEAHILLEKVVAAHPDNVPARSTLAQVLDNPLNPRRNPALAEHHFLEVLKRARTNTEDARSLGLIYMAQGRYKQAAFIFTLMLASKPNSAAARLQLSKAYAKLGNSTLGKAQGAIAYRLIDRDTRENELGARRSEKPTGVPQRLALAQHYMDHRQYSLALPELQAAFALAPQSPEVRKLQKEFDLRVGVSLAPFAARVASGK